MFGVLLFCLCNISIFERYFADMSSAPRREIIDLTGSDDEVVDCDAETPAQSPRAESTSPDIANWNDFMPQSDDLVSTHEHLFKTSRFAFEIEMDDAEISSQDMQALRDRVFDNDGHIAFEMSVCQTALGPRVAGIRVRALVGCLPGLSDQDRCLLNGTLKCAIDSLVCLKQREWHHIISTNMSRNKFSVAVSAWPFVSFQTGVVFLVFAALREQHKATSYKMIQTLMKINNYYISEWAEFLETEPHVLFKNSRNFLTVDIANPRRYLFSIYVPAWEM